MSVSENIRRLRKEKGVTQKVIADYLGIKINSYSQYENNVRFPSVDMIKKIAEYHDVFVEQLIYEKNKTNHSSLDELNFNLHDYIWSLINVYKLIKTIDELFSDFESNRDEIIIAIDDLKVLLSDISIIKNEVKNDFFDIDNIDSIIDMYIERIKTTSD